MLSALQMGFRTLTIQQRSTEVWRLLGLVENEAARFTDSLEETRRRLHQAEEAMDTAVSRSRSLQRRLKDLDTESPYDPGAAGKL
jgi:DNA recombination protein RmuC